MSETQVKVAESDTKASVIKAQGVKSQEDTHYKNWPNDLGFYAGREEQCLPRELHVSGIFPSWCQGDLLRIGPGSHKFPMSNPKDGELNLSHWFDGFSHVHKFTITSDESEKSAAKVLYQSRRQADEKLIDAQRTGKISGISFGQKRDPCDTFFKKMKAVWEPAGPKGPRMEDISVAFVKPVHQVNSSDSTSDKDKTKTTSLSATSDRVVTKQFDVSTLEPYGVTNQSALHPALNGQLSAAHNQTDPETGDVFNYNLALGPRPTYRIFRINASTGATDLLATISGRGIEAAYLHSFFLTRNFVILCIWSATLGAGGAKILWERNVMDAIAPFDPTKKAVWCVVDRRGGRGMVSKFESDAMFCFHTVNAWEEEEPPAYDDAGDGLGEGKSQQRGGCCGAEKKSCCSSRKSSCGSRPFDKAITERKVNIVAEMVEYPNTDILHKFYLSHLASTGPGAAKYADTPISLTRYRLASVPLHATPSPRAGCCGDKTASNTNKCMASRPAEVVQRICGPAAGDLPQINPAFATRPHRYVWGVLDRGLSSFVDALGKTDTATGECKVWGVAGHSPGEPVFVADPRGSGDEDEGVLLSVVLDGERGGSYLLCLDARTMEEVCRAEVGGVVPFGFHGIHLAAQ